jgi:hypothetical protein
LDFWFLNFFSLVQCQYPYWRAKSNSYWWDYFSNALKIDASEPVVETDWFELMAVDDGFFFLFCFWFLVSVGWQAYNSFNTMKLDFISWPFLISTLPFAGLQHMQQCQVRVFPQFLFQALSQMNGALKMVSILGDWTQDLSVMSLLL